MFKSTGCSSRGFRYNFQHPHGGSPQSVTTSPKSATPSSGLWAPNMNLVHRYNTGKTPIHENLECFKSVFKAFKDFF